MFCLRFAAVLIAALVWAPVAVRAQGDPLEKPSVKRESKAGRLVRATYPVADLVVPPGSPAERPVTTEKRLMEAIRSLVAPGSWVDAGGQGRMEYFPTGLSLVVQQTRRNHREITRLLEDLRRRQDVQASLQVRLVTLPEGLAAYFRDLADFRKISTPDQGSVEGTFLTERQTRAWMRLVQGYASANILHAPKVTLFNGQPATLCSLNQELYRTGFRLTEEVGSEPVSTPVETGWSLSLLPVVLADGSTLRLHFHAKHTTLDEVVPVREVKVLRLENGVEKLGIDHVQEPRVRTLALEKVVTIAPGRTFVCSMGKTTVERRTAFGPTWLKDLPYVSRLVGNVGVSREGREMFLLITPRVFDAGQEAPIPPGQTVSADASR